MHHAVMARPAAPVISEMVHSAHDARDGGSRLRGASGVGGGGGLSWAGALSSSRVERTRSTRVDLPVVGETTSSSTYSVSNCSAPQHRLHALCSASRVRPHVQPRQSSVATPATEPHTIMTQRKLVSE